MVHITCSLCMWCLRSNMISNWLVSKQAFAPTYIYLYSITMCTFVHVGLWYSRILWQQSHVWVKSGKWYVWIKQKLVYLPFVTLFFGPSSLKLSSWNDCWCNLSIEFLSLMHLILNNRSLLCQTLQRSTLLRLVLPELSKNGSLHLG